MTTIQTEVMLPATIGIQTIGVCPVCQRHLCSRKVWDSITADVRKQIVKKFARINSRRLCSRCIKQLHGTDELFDHERVTVALDIFAEEYNLLRAQGVTERLIAEKLGLYRGGRPTESRRMDTFQKALKRARNRGLIT